MGGVVLIVAMSMYFLPCFIAWGRRHHQSAAIAVLNLLLGWTFLGWVVALVWACTATPAQGTLPLPTAGSAPVRDGVTTSTVPPIPPSDHTEATPLATPPASTDSPWRRVAIFLALVGGVILLVWLASNLPTSPPTGAVSTATAPTTPAVMATLPPKRTLIRSVPAGNVYSYENAVGETVEELENRQGQLISRRFYRPPLPACAYLRSVGLGTDRYWRDDAGSGASTA